jgi:hypothetical protein
METSEIENCEECGATLHPDSNMYGCLGNFQWRHRPGSLEKFSIIESLKKELEEKDRILETARGIFLMISKCPIHSVQSCSCQRSADSFLAHFPTQDKQEKTK